MTSITYSHKILQKYGSKRNLIKDMEFKKLNKFPHEYSIMDRKSLEHLPIYVIDPKGCQDADDGFSIYTNKEKLMLAIHIADPTEHIELNSKLWKDMCYRTITHYPSGNDPIHLTPQYILENSSLMENSCGKIKNAISIVTEISKNTFLPIGKIKYVFSKISVDKKYNFSYQEVAELFEKHVCELDTDKFIKNIKVGIKISNALKKSRKAVGKKLGEIKTSHLTEKFDGFYNDSDGVILIKQMIAEFAIFANSFIGNYLRIKLGKEDVCGIFRSCQIDIQNKLKIDSFLTGDDIFKYIVKNGVSADYLSKCRSHDLVGKSEYCHFTSPIRRVVDCVCHYLLKYVHLRETKYPDLELEIPFTKTELEILSQRCTFIAKKEKKIQFSDRKFRCFQVLKNLSEIDKIKNNMGIPITVEFNGYSGLFLNILITSINGFKVSLSYSLKIKNYKFIQFWEEFQKIGIYIYNINLNKRFDEGSLPELDRIMKYPYY